MTKIQRELLIQLTEVMLGLGRECDKDDNFNDLVHELHIFSKSLDEASNDILNVL